MFSKIDAVDDKDLLKDMYERVIILNRYLDTYDSRDKQIVDTVSGIVYQDIKGKIKNQISDIFDNFDKIDIYGKPIYSDSDMIQIYDTIGYVNRTCDSEFWLRFKRMN